MTDHPDMKTYEVGIALMLAARNTTASRNRLLKPYGLSSVSWFALGLIDDKTAAGGVRVTEIASLFDVKTTYITFILNQLRGKGYVMTNPDPHDARARRLVVTKEGARLVGKIEKLLQAETDKLLKRKVGSGQFKQYVQVLNKLAETE